MTLYAFDAIDDSIDATRAFLWPFDLGRWARLALVVFFVGAVSGFNPFQFNPGGGGPGTPDGPGSMPSIDPAQVAIVLAVAALVLLIVLVFMLVGSIMEFVFVESLRREAVTVGRYWGEHWRDGIRLFGFRVVLGIVTLALVGLLLAAAAAPALVGEGSLSIGLLLLVLPVLAVVAVIAGLVNGFTTVFVVPVMIVEECGVLQAWRRFWPTVRGQWKQYAVYAVMGLVLQIAGGIVAGLASLFGLIALLVPFGIVGLVGFLLFQASPIAGGIVIGVVVLAFVVAALALVLSVSVPIQTFLRYYALFVLGDTNEAFDLIAERRRALREDEASASG